MNDTRPCPHCESGTIPVNTRRKRCDACTAERKRHHAQSQGAKRQQVRVSLAEDKLTQLLYRGAIRTHEQVGTMMGISAERVRQIEQSAISKIIKQFKQERHEIRNS
jgi:DNA-directed RNA polymerase specialized sigma subunit